MNEKIQLVPHLTDEQRNDIISKHTEIDNYFNQIKTIVETTPTYKDPGMSIDDVHVKLDVFKGQITKILNAPPPKTEEKKEAPASEGNK